ncbi:uncharacterized protein K452DRAFT_87675 [Aplosporella prunicola CBS 121167]|uniref:Uncharacterized protein n=1 Tax=Aplosporella prunicola CBS 121167 TaxID=1176127 RepID=A0A6A6B2V3_9PEZI|nr:uncharacterized protein K452DRAFT_87675 [Aplosporella prunicola CBS 121167]KAF2138519.1 hypothetical protein K452DRAFT_87675 [Aplosporella prunicola CBS 121167]
MCGLFSLFVQHHLSYNDVPAAAVISTAGSYYCIYDRVNSSAGALGAIVEDLTKKKQKTQIHTIFTSKADTESPSIFEPGGYRGHLRASARRAQTPSSPRLVVCSLPQSARYSTQAPCTPPCLLRYACGVACSRMLLPLPLLLPLLLLLLLLQCDITHYMQTLLG